MVRVDYLEGQIREVEGFDVAIQWPDGSNVRGDFERARSYRYERAARDSWTVAEWIRERFHHRNPQFDVSVLDNSGNPVSGRHTLGTVRETY